MVWCLSLPGGPARRAAGATGKKRSGVVVAVDFAAKPPAPLVDRARIGIEDDAFDTAQRSEAAPLCPADQGKVHLTRQVHAPSRKARTADQDRNPHAHDLDDHFRGQPPGRGEKFALWSDA